jgi:LuxR family maltose regulon positive regulatory protein
MALAYPAYLKASSEESAFSENAIRILKLQGEGMSTVEIASALELKIETVKYHNKQNYKKLGVNSKTAAVTEARRLKLI